MKLRILISAVLRATLAAPVVATTAWFPDVPDDHRRIDAIRYAKTEGLFLGFPDGNLRPDEELTSGQFVKVAERLYDRYDSWTRADWAQVMYGGLPSLTGSSPPVTNNGGGTAAPVSDPALCGWPLGEAEPVGEVPVSGGPPEEVRWPITPCAPPVTYRIEFQEQTLNLPYRSADPTFTPALDWRTNANKDAAKVKVTEFRPGGPVEGTLAGERWIPWRAVRERKPTSAGTIPFSPTPATFATTTTAAPPPTRAPAVTIPPPEVVYSVPFEDRDVTVHWFVHPGGDRRDDTPFIGVYLADPGGPINYRGTGFHPYLELLMHVNTSSGEGELHSGEDRGLELYTCMGGWDCAAPDAFGVFSPMSIPRDFTDIEVDYVRERNREKAHFFRSVTIHRVEPPSESCLPAWREERRSVMGGDGVKARPECHPAEWDAWWGVRANTEDIE